MQQFTDVFVNPGERTTITYRSGLATYEELFDGGILCAGGVNGAGYPLDVLMNCQSYLNYRRLAEPASFALTVNGIRADINLNLEGVKVSETESGKEAVVTLTHRVLPLTIEARTLLDGTQMMARHLVLKNNGDAPLSVSRLALLSGGVEQLDRAQMGALLPPESLYSIGYFSYHDWGREGVFDWYPLEPGAFTVDTRFNRARHRHPMVCLRNNLTGLIFFAQTAFSGGCRFVADLNTTDETSFSMLTLTSELTGYAPLIVLKPGETYVTPEVHFGTVIGGVDEMVNEMNAHARKSVLNMKEADGSALLVGAGMGAEHDMTVETTKRYMEQMARMGAEVFIIDAGWECPLEKNIDWGGCNGRNIPDPGRYPNGIDEVVDYCHKLGMKFALWVEIERLGDRSPAFQAHPEWRSKNIFGQQSGGYIDFSIPEAAAWAESELARIISEYKMDLLRVDYNVDNRDYFAMRDMGTGIPECIALRHFEAVYKMYQNLKRRFPNVIFENCAGGGGRTDWGQMKAFNHTWVTDWQRPPYSCYITNGMTLALPPERVDRLFAGMGCHENGSLEFHMRNTMLTHMTLNVITSRSPANERQMAFVQHSTKLYKDFIRPFLPTAKVFHHTAELSVIREKKYIALEVAAADQTCGTIGVFGMPEHGDRAEVIVPRGIDPSRSYRVTFDNTGATVLMDGATLMNEGIRVRVPGALSSELILFKAV